MLSTWNLLGPHLLPRAHWKEPHQVLGSELDTGVTSGWSCSDLGHSTRVYACSW